MSKTMKKDIPRDTVVGIRTITQIEKLPVTDLTDEEICKLFFRRFDADSLIMLYTDKAGSVHLFGRLFRTRNAREFYDRLKSSLTRAWGAACDWKETE